MPTQLSMTGEDWLSDRDRKQQAQADRNLKKTSVEAARKMRAASEAVRAQYRAYLEAGHPDKMGDGDGRLRLIASLEELAAYFESVYDKE